MPTNDSPIIYTLDIETRPNEVYSWSLWNQNHSTSQIIKPAGILSFAAKRLDKKAVEFHADWDENGHDGMIRRLHEIYDEADGIISYNGAKFDSKWIKGEFALAGLNPPSPLKEIDLLRTVRKNFNFPSRKLDYVAQQLGLGGKVQHSGQALWNECLRPTSEASGKRARALMRKYNIGDVKLTEQLYYRLLPWIDPGVNVALFADDGDPRCINCGSDHIQSRGYAYTTAVRYRRYQCQACGKWLRSRRMESTTPLRNVV